MEGKYGGKSKHGLEKIIKADDMPFVKLSYLVNIVLSLLLM